MLEKLSAYDDPGMLESGNGDDSVDDEDELLAVIIWCLLLLDTIERSSHHG